MAICEDSVTLEQQPEEALRSCTRALIAAGFKDVETNQPAMMVTGRKRAVGQWTKDQVTAMIEPEGEGTRVTITANAKAQSLTSLASSPAERIVNKVLLGLAA